MYNAEQDFSEEGSNAVVEENKRFVFRLSLATLRKLNEHCQTNKIRSKSAVIRRAISYFNEVPANVVSVKTWKLLCPRGAEMVSVWADAEMVALAKKRAAGNNISLNHYIELALKSTLTPA